MTELEKVELALRRAASHWGANGTDEGDLINRAFHDVADEIAKILKDHKGEP